MARDDRSMRRAGMRSCPATIGRAHRAVVAQHHQGEQHGPAIDSARALRSVSSGVAVGIEHHQIGLAPGRDRADAVVERERARAAERREVEGFDRAQRAAVELRDLVGRAHRGEQREAGAAADVGAEPDLHRAARVLHVADAKQPGAEEQVRGRAVCERGAALVAAAELRLRRDGRRAPARRAARSARGDRRCRDSSCARGNSSRGPFDLAHGSPRYACAPARPGARATACPRHRAAPACWCRQSAA